jgi:mannose-6-phosphate isomerase-like protein (cupin superfamily)
MPVMSKTTADKTEEFPLALDFSGDRDGYTIDFVTIRETHSLKDVLAGLPNGQCQCPHWGYLFTGRMTVDYGHRQDVIEAGDAFYMPPGHVPTTEAGSEVVQFSPTDQLAATHAAIVASMQQA